VKLLRCFGITAVTVAAIASAESAAMAGPKSRAELCDGGGNVTPVAWIEACSVAISTDTSQKGRAVALYNRARAYRANGDNNRAVGDYTQAISLLPDFAIAFQNRGVAYNALGDTDRAIADPWAYNNRGDAYFLSGDWNSAIADYSHAIALNPQLSYALFARGAAKTHRGDAIAGLADMDAALALNPKVAEEQARDGIRPGTGV